jgi:hypothetical protein
MNALAQSGILIAALVIGWLIKSFMPSYFSEKGKNVATKEDIEEITKKIEGVKSAIGSRLHTYQVRYEHEFKILLELSEKLVAARDAAQSLRPESGYGDIKDPEVKKKRMTRYIETSRDLYQFMESRQPFFPEKIHETVKAHNDAAWKEFVEFKNREPEESPKYWENAERNGAVIGAIAGAVQLQIRERIARWEAFEPGP